MTALRSLRVLDLSDSVAGQYCSRLMSGYGADVTLIERPGGSRLRQAPPMSEKWGDSWLFYNLNLDKTSLELDWQSEAGFEILCGYSAHADIVLVPQSCDSLGLHHRAPETIICEIGDFACDGPYADWRGGEMIHQALAGTMYRNGRPGEEPLFGCGHRSYGLTGIAAYTAILAALRRGGGELVRIDVHTTAASASYQLANQYLQNGTVDLRDGPQNTAEMIVPCREGWAVIFIYPHKWQAICENLGLEHLLSDPRLNTHRDRLAHWTEITDAVSAVTVDRDAKEIMESLQASGVPSTMAFRPRDLRDSEHLGVRKYWREVSSDGEMRPAMGEVYRIADAEWRTENPCQPRGSAQNLHADRIHAKRQKRNGTPLAGVRVLDLTTAWAGPLAGRVLAALGAEVVHVESVARMDLARGAPNGDHPRRFVDLDPGARPYNRAIFFNAQNLNKRSLSIDIKKPGGAETLQTLARNCDVVLANFSPGTLARMGLVYDEIAKENPGLIYLEMPACGTWGPMSMHTGLGPNMEFASGMASFVGYGDGQPFWTGPAYLDPIGGYNGAAAILTALHNREETGRGARIEISQCEAAMPLIGELILDCLERDADPEPQGNALATKLVHGAYVCAGHEEWIAISCDVADWSRLAALLAEDGVLSDAGVAPPDPPRMNQLLSAWTSTKAKQPLAERLQSAGIAAAPVNTGQDVAQDRQLNATGFFDDIWHPEVGMQRYQGLPFRFREAPLPQLKHAPLLGEHSVEVLESWGGLSRQDVMRLHAAGVISTGDDTPFASDARREA